MEKLKLFVIVAALAVSLPASADMWSDIGWILEGQTASGSAMVGDSGMLDVNKTFALRRPLIMGGQVIFPSVGLAGIHLPRRQAGSDLAAQAIFLFNDKAAGKEFFFECYAQITELNRMLCLPVRNPKDPALELVKAGLAWVDSRPGGPLRYQVVIRGYRKAEAEARQNRVGMWERAETTPSAQYRAHVERDTAWFR